MSGKGPGKKSRAKRRAAVSAAPLTSSATSMTSSTSNVTRTDGQSTVSALRPSNDEEGFIFGGPSSSSLQPSNSETTVTTFSSGSCSYLSPFSTNASFVMLGGGECEEDIFIKPKNLQPIISVQPPSPAPRHRSGPQSQPTIFSSLLTETSKLTMSPVMGSRQNNLLLSPGDGVTVPRLTVPGVTVPSLTVPGVTVPEVTVPGFNKFTHGRSLSADAGESRRSGDLPNFDQFDIRSINETDDDVCPEIRITGLKKSASSTGPRKISLDSVCISSDKSFVARTKRSFSVSEKPDRRSVHSLEDGSKKGTPSIWRQLKNSKVFGVGKVASVISSLQSKKSKANLSATIQEINIREYKISEIFATILRNYR